MSDTFSVPFRRIDEAKRIIDMLKADKITMAQAKDEMYRLAFGRYLDHDLEDLVHRVKECGHPPYRGSDPYYERHPWNKFGGISSGIAQGWNWYRDEVIINTNGLTKEDAMAALYEIEESKRKEAECATSNE